MDEEDIESIEDLGVFLIKYGDKIEEEWNKMESPDFRQAVFNVMEEERG